MRLHGHPRSAATWRVRIALALKGLDITLAEPPASPEELSTPPIIDPQALPLVLEADSLRLTESLAIVEWLEEMWPTPPLLPPEPALRARIRAFALCLAGDMHLLPAGRSITQLGLPEGTLRSWVRQTLANGLEACEAQLDHAEGPFCFGPAPGMADLCLVPQLAMARQFGVPVSFPRLLAAEAACLTLPAFQASRPPAS